MRHTQLSQVEQIGQQLTGSCRNSPPATLVRATADLPIPRRKMSAACGFVARSGTMAHEVIDAVKSRRINRETNSLLEKVLFD